MIIKRKNRRPVIILIFAIFLGATGLILALNDNQNINQIRPVVIATIEWEPYVGSRLKENGPLGKLISETVLRMKFRPEFSYSSWDMCLEKTEEERVFGTFPGIMTEERKDSFKFSKPILTTEYVLFYKKSRMEPKVQQLRKKGRQARLDTFKFGKVKGYSVWKQLEDAVGDPDKFTEYYSIQQAFDSLEAGAIDFLPEGKIPGLTAIGSSDFKGDASDIGFVENDPDSIFGARVSFHLLLPIKTKLDIKDFNEALDSTMEKSTYHYDTARINRGSIIEHIELQPVEGMAFVEIMEHASSPTKLFTPSGTRAALYEWPKKAGLEENPNERLEWCEVKLLNGPLRGRMVWVDPRSIKLLTPSD